jgi:hypothetical protein
MFELLTGCPEALEIKNKKALDNQELLYLL